MAWNNNGGYNNNNRNNGRNYNNNNNDNGAKNNQQSIGALWEYRKSNGEIYFKGNIDGKKIVVWLNTYKDQNNNQPNFRIFADDFKPSNNAAGNNNNTYNNNAAGNNNSYSGNNSNYRAQNNNNNYKGNNNGYNGNNYGGSQPSEQYSAPAPKVYKNDSVETAPDDLPDF